MKIPSWIKWVFTLYMALLIPTYWANYGLSNFLWYSDILLFLTFFATLLESRLLASMAAAGGIVSSLTWTAVFLYSIFAYLLQFQVNKIPAYMFEEAIPLWVRGLSLFHIALAPYSIWLIRHLVLGYEQRGWIYQVVLIWLLGVTTWLTTTKAANINFIYSYESMGLAPFPFIVLICSAVSLIVVVTHLAIKYSLKKF